jgi:Ion channel
MLAVLSFCVLSIAARHLAFADEVDRELLCGAVGAYLLLGVFWANTYQIINFVDPEAFHGLDGGVLKRSALYYFSFTTLTTTGYGDIMAVDPLVRMWAIFEAIIGSMYNAIVIARLVSLYGRPAGREKH